MTREFSFDRASPASSGNPRRAAERAHERKNAWDSRIAAAQRSSLEEFLDTEAGLERAHCRNRTRFGLPRRRLSLPAGLATLSGGLHRPRAARRAVAPGRPILRYVLLGIAFTVALSAFGAFLLVAAVAFNAARADEAIEVFLRRIECSRFANVRSEDGSHWADLAPSIPDCGEYRRIRTAPFPPDVGAALAHSFGVLEGAWRPGETVIGHDAKGVAKQVLITLREQLIPFGKHVPVLGGLAGGTAPISTAIEAFSGANGGKLTIPQKLHWMGLATRFALGEGREEQARVDLISTLPAIIGHGGLPLGGPAASMILFGSLPDAPWQECFFAAAQGKPVIWNRMVAFEPDVMATWYLAKARGSHCLRQRIEDAEELETQLTLLAAYSPPAYIGRPTIDAALARAIRSSQRLAGAESAAADIVTTVSPEAQRLLLGAGDLAQGSGIFADAAAALPSRHCLHPSECGAPLEMALAVAEITGEGLHLRAVRTNQQGALFGPMRPTEAGGWTRVRPALGQASLGKLALIIPMAQIGETTLCSRAVGNIRDPDGFMGVASCADASGRAAPSISEAIAGSHNLGPMDFVRRHPDRVQDVLDRLGWVGERSDHLPFAAVFGTGQTGAPADLMQLAAALATGESPPLTAVVGIAADGDRSIRLEDFDLDAAARARVAEWFRAPVRKGTLSSTAHRISVAGCTVTHGKTGTDSRSGRNLSRRAVMVAECEGGRTFALYAGIWTGDFEGSVGSLSHSDLAPMLEAALRVAVQAPG